ncbi:LAGLIDADG family homing endonuclease [Chlorogloea sp. CCALA 695]|uniref:LAGLIDADG family homing endonuclease n=1 Tax=Chlorogloea sp. CCALA 695 TaxID=2107693 RepID=UPI000D071155|nr:LAGLIDADG family homing endonuclease [Chlorogloea sp. CCALA 695]PSB26344.1 hypothetical protein C7B70_24035 [Chlorogloea sp. CCALA 695]
MKTCTTWTEQDLDVLTKNYKIFSYQDLAFKLNKTEIAVRTRISKLGLGRKRHTLNESYFEYIDNPNKAYFLGFIMGDGCVSKNRLKISIHKKDSIILETFKELLDATQPITKCVESKLEICIYNPQIVLSLNKWNIIERKSFVAQLPKLEDTYLPHFIRGIFDADGSICRRKYIPKKQYSGAYFCIGTGSSGMAKDLNKVFILNNINTSIRTRVREGKKPYYEIHTSNNSEIAKLKDFLYSSADFYLKRKYEVF